MTPDSSNSPLFQGNPYSFQQAGSAYWRPLTRATWQHLPAKDTISQA
jgi:hypothetical protein